MADPNSPDYELSADDITRIIRRYKLSFNKARDIISYPELKFKNIQQLLPHEGDFKVIYFITDKPTPTQEEGHWTLLFKQQGKYTFFDPYSIQPDLEERWIPRYKRIQYHEDEPLIHELIPVNQLVYNHYPFQSQKQGINTCGKWVCFVVLFCCINGHNLKEMHHFMETERRKSHSSYDDLVCQFIRL